MYKRHTKSACILCVCAWIYEKPFHCRYHNSRRRKIIKSAWKLFVLRCDCKKEPTNIQFKTVQYRNTSQLFRWMRGDTTKFALFFFPYKTGVCVCVCVCVRALNKYYFASVNASEISKYSMIARCIGQLCNNTITSNRAPETFFHHRPPPK